MNSHKLIFWDRPDLQNMSFEELQDYIKQLRQKKNTFELNFIIRRYVERGNSVEGILLFEPEEIDAAVRAIKSSKRALMFCDPIRLRAWQRAAALKRKLSQKYGDKHAA